MKTHRRYVAKFSDGQIVEIKKSTRHYTHAYKTVVAGGWADAKPCAFTGFSGSAELAAKAIRREPGLILAGNPKIRYAGDSTYPPGRIISAEIVAVEETQL